MTISESTDEINKTFETIKNKLNKLQESMLNVLKNKFLSAENNFKLIKLSLASIYEEMEHDQILNLHFNKLPMFLEFFQEKSKF